MTAAGDSLEVGRGYLTGALLHWSLRDGHVVVEGDTGGGKSTLVYRWLAHLAAAPDVLIAGSDLTSRAVGPAWDGTRHRTWQAVGFDLEAHAALLEDLAALVDRRAAAGDLAPSVDRPLVVVVVEELPALLRFAGRHSRVLRDRIVAAYLHVLEGGHRATLRVVTVSHGALAEAWPCGYGRDHAALRVSFRTPPLALAVLHEPVHYESDLARDHSRAPVGVAVVSVPGGPALRVRTEDLPGGHAEYERLLAAARDPPLELEARTPARHTLP